MLQAAGYLLNCLLAILLWTLAKSGILSRLRWFGISLGIRLIQAALQSAFPKASEEYIRFWFLLDTLLLAVFVLAAIEIYLEVTREVYQLGKVGGAVAFVAVALGAAAAAATTESSVRLIYDAELKRTVYVFLTAGLGAVTWFYGRFPIPMASYVWPHARIFLVYAATQAIGYWESAVAAGGQWICLIAWLGLFSRPLSYPSTASEAELDLANRRARKLERTVNQ